MKINLNRYYFLIILWFPILYSFSSLFFPTINNNLTFIFTIISLLFLHKLFISDGKINVKVIVFDFFLLLYSIYTYINSSVGDLLNYDFYCFVLLFCVFTIFLDSKIRNDFYTYELDNRKSFNIRFLLFIILIVYSIIFSNGLKIGYGSSIPVLYGPFTLPHILAYLFIAYYLEISLIYGNNKVTVLLKILCIISCLWTAVRSAFIGILIICLYDIVSIKKMNKRVLVFSSIFLLLFIVMYTKILVNNPLFEKTIDANNSGSITSGREIFRESARKKYLYDTSLDEKIMGIGMNNVRNTMYKTTKLKIHVHNDYYNLLLGYGLLGLGLFVFSLFKAGKIFKKKYSQIFFHLLIFCLAYYNGFAMYILLTIYLPVIFLFFEKT